MGTGAILAPLVASAVSAGASYYNTQQTAKKQDAELAAQIAAQGQRQREADALVQDTILKQQQSSAEGDRQSSLRDYMTQLQRSHGNAVAGLGQVGALNERFNEAADAASADISATGQRTADIMSRIDAPMRQREREGYNFGRLGSEIDRIGALSRSDAYLGDLRMRSIKRNPWLDALASVAGSYAGNYAPAAGAVAGAAQGSANFGALSSGIMNTDYARGGGTFGTLDYRKRGQLYGGY